MKYKVLYITFMQNYFNTLVQRTHHIINDMQKREEIEQIDVICIDNSQLDKVKICKEEKKIKYYSVRVTPAWKYGFGHISNTLKMFFRFKKANKKKYDYIIAETPWGGIVAILLKFVGRSKYFIYEDMDYFPGFYTKSKIRNFIVDRFEKLVLRNADLVITVGRELFNLRKGYTKKSMHIIHNGVNFNLFNNSQLEKKNNTTIIYMGKLDDWGGIDIAIRSMPKILKKIPNLKFWIIGEGNCEEKLKKLTNRLKVASNVKFLGLKRYEELPQYLNKAYIGIATFKPIELMKYAFTLKIVEYGAAGLPVICTRIGETERYIENNKTGILINWNENDFVKAVIKLTENKELYKILSTNGIRAAKNMNWDQLLQKRYEIINNEINNKIAGDIYD